METLESLPPRRLASCLESMNQPFEDGTVKEKLEPLGQKEDKEDTFSVIRLKKKSKTQPKLKRLSTVESLLESKKTIWKGKLVTYRNSTQDMKSSKTLARESTLSGKVLSPFWNVPRTEWSKRLWWPQETDCPGSGLNCWNGSSNLLESSCWFWNKKTNLLKKNSPMTSYPSFKFSVAEETEEDVTKIRKELVKSYQVKILPDRKQKRILNDWWNGYRYMYNKSLETIKKEGLKRPNKLALKTRLAIQKQNPKLYNRKKFLADTPKAIRQQAVFECVKNLKGDMTHHKDITIVGRCS